MPARTSVATLECRFSISKNSETAPCSRRFHATILAFWAGWVRELPPRAGHKWELLEENAPLDVEHRLWKLCIM